MKVKQIIKVAEAIDDTRKMPCDMHDLDDHIFYRWDITKEKRRKK